MSAILLNRALGNIGPQSFQRYKTARLLHALQPAPSVAFDASKLGAANEQESRKRKAQDQATLNKPAHPTGASALAIDRNDGRYLLSGGADSSILLWDLEKGLPPSQNHVHRPKGTVKRSSSTHGFSITHLSFYSTDPGAFLSSSYDHTLKVYDTNALSVAASWDLDVVVHSHSLSPTAEQDLVACATQHPAIRLVDIRSGASVQALVGHQGAVLSVAWSPHNAFLLASGGSDGVVRLWDVRRGNPSLGVLDLDDALGSRTSHRPRERGSSHAGACNGVVWSEDGEYIISAGHDEQVRVWDAGAGANTLVHFGPTLKNPRSATLLPLIIPSHVSSVGQRVMVYPNGKEILMFDMLEGTLLKRLPVPMAVVSQNLERGWRSVPPRITSMGFRKDHVEMYSAHADGFIRLWAPRTWEDVAVDEEEAQTSQDTEDGDSRQKKRQELDQIYRDLTKRPITFT